MLRAFAWQVELLFRWRKNLLQPNGFVILTQEESLHYGLHSDEGRNLLTCNKKDASCLSMTSRIVIRWRKNLLQPNGFVILTQEESLHYGLDSDEGRNLLTCNKKDASLVYSQGKLLSMTSCLLFVKEFKTLQANT